MGLMKELLKNNTKMKFLAPGEFILTGGGITIFSYGWCNFKNVENVLGNADSLDIRVMKTTF